MNESWLICVHYCARVFRKPWLVCFLLAIPFLILLAEFAAFGRPASLPALATVPLEIASGEQTERTRQILSCLQNQPGHPLQLMPAPVSTRPAHMDRLVFSNGSANPLRIEFTSGAENAEGQLLELSLVNLCVASPKQPPVALLIRRRAPDAAGKALSRGVFIAQFFPGLALFGALFLSQALASSVWRDQQRAVQKRLLSFPIWRGSVVVGPALFLTIGASGALSLVLVASFFVIPSAVPGLPLLLLTALGFGFFASGLQLLIGFWAGSQRAAQAVSASVSMMLAFFGGGFVPLALYPPFLRAAAYQLPNGAAQTAFTQILLGARTPWELALPITTVWIWAATAITAAMLMQARTIRL